MRQLRQTLRLHLDAGLSLRETARLLKLGKTTVGDILLKARAAGVDWAAAQGMSDEELERRLYAPPVPLSSRQLEPEWAHVHRELKRPGVTLQLLWEEYARGNQQAYKYTSFCVKYREWAATLKRSMRQTHVAGEKLFVDYAGQTVPIVDAITGEIRQAQIFVGVLGAFNYFKWLGAAADWATEAASFICLRLPEQRIVALLDACGALRATAHHEIPATRLRRRIGNPLEASQLLGQCVAEDEVAAGPPATR